MHVPMPLSAGEKKRVFSELSHGETLLTLSISLACEPREAFWQHSDPLYYWAGQKFDRGSPLHLMDAMFRSSLVEGMVFSGRPRSLS